MKKSCKFNNTMNINMLPIWGKPLIKKCGTGNDVSFFKCIFFLCHVIFRCSSLKQKQDYANTAIPHMIIMVMERLITLFVFFCFVSYPNSTNNSWCEMLFASMDFNYFSNGFGRWGRKFFPVHLFFCHDNDKCSYQNTQCFRHFHTMDFTRETRFF